MSQKKTKTKRGVNGWHSAPVLSCPVLFLSCPVLFLSCAVPVMSCSCPVLFLSCPVLSCSWPVLSCSCPVLFLSCSCPVLSCPVLSRIRGRHSPPSLLPLRVRIAFMFDGGEGVKPRSHKWSLKALSDRIFEDACFWTSQSQKHVIMRREWWEWWRWTPILEVTTFSTVFSHTTHTKHKMTSFLLQMTLSLAQRVIRTQSRSEWAGGLGGRAPPRTESTQQTKKVYPLPSPSLFLSLSFFVCFVLFCCCCCCVCIRGIYILYGEEIVMEKKKKKWRKK